MVSCCESWQEGYPYCVTKKGGYNGRDLKDRFWHCFLKSRFFEKMPQNHGKLGIFRQKTVKNGYF